MSKLFYTFGVLFVCSFLYMVSAQIFKDACLNAHNRFRSLHGVPNLVLDDTLQASALEWARYLASTGKFEFRQPNPYGSNMCWYIGKVATGFNVSKDWYDEIERYDYDNPSHSRFTQLVWKSSEKLGCAFAKNATTDRTVVVAYYSPPGNVQGRFEQNVPRPIN